MGADRRYPPGQRPARPGACAPRGRRERARGRRAAGMQYAARAVELDPDQAGAWLLLAMRALDAGQASPAADALRPLQQLLGAEAPAVVLGWARLDLLQ